MSNLDLKVLWVDDERSILEAFSQVVLTYGLTPIPCTSPIEAEAVFRREKANLALVISDLQMPGRSGFDFRSALLPDTAAVPFILVSAYITKDMALRAIDLKIDGFYDKPINDNEITAILAKHAAPRIAAIREAQALEAIFIDEATSIIDEMDTTILSLDSDRSNIETLNSLFRGAHTIKGSSGVLSSDVVTRYVHRYEDIISSLKKGDTQFTDEVYEVLLKGFDRIKELITAAASKKLGNYRLADLIPELNLKGTVTKDGTPLSTKPALEAAAPVKRAKTASPQGDAVRGGRDSIPVPIEILETMSACSGEITVLRNMVNKLVRSLEHQCPGNKEVASLGELLDEMHKVNGTIQNHVVDLRKVPVSTVLKTVPRIVRDLGKDLGKSLTLRIEGEKLRIDSSLAAALSNSLVHLVRNSADHGIEDAKSREAAGKPGTGTISVTCREVSEEVVVTVADDGRGMDAAKIRAKALEKNLFTAAQLAEMSPAEVYGIIFASGFSTAAKVTDVSGRGVGMDMVKSSVEAVGGTITVASEMGSGSTFTLRLPIPKSVLIIRSLAVECAGRVLAVPQDAIVRVLCVDLQRHPDAVQMASLGRTLRQSGSLYPLVSLNTVLASNPNTHAPSTTASTMLSVLILKAEGLEYALEIDKILDAEEIVVKRLKPYFNPHGAFTGATFMGDGSVGLILDVLGVAKLAGLDVSKAKAKGAALEPLNLDGAPTQLGQRFVLFKLRSKAIFGVPLAQVFRLEELEAAKIRRSGAQRVIIYRDSIMPIFPMEHLLRLSGCAALDINQRERVPTIVAKVAGAPGAESFFGLEVESVIDIAPSEGDVSEDVRDRVAIIGNAIIRDHNVTIVDLDQVLGKAVGT